MNVDRYGMLVTVSSLLFLVVYAEEGYDAWDILIAGIATVFGIKFITSDIPKDSFELLLSSLICCGGTFVVVTGTYSIVMQYSQKKLLPLVGWEDGSISISFVVVIVATLILFFFFRGRTT